MDREFPYGLFFLPLCVVIAFVLEPPLAFMMIATILVVSVTLTFAHSRLQNMWVSRGIIGTIILGCVGFLLWYVHSGTASPLKPMIKDLPISNTQISNLLLAYTTTLKKIAVFGLIGAMGLALLCILILEKSKKTINDESQEATDYIKELENKNQSLQQQLKSLQQQLTQKESTIVWQNNEIENLKSQLSNAIQAKQDLDAIQDFLFCEEYHNYNLNELLNKKFNELHHMFVFGNHRQLSESLQDYNKLAMYMAFFGQEKQYPTLFTDAKPISYNNIVGNVRLYQPDTKALYKHICWLLFVLKRSKGLNAEQHSQIKTYIDKLTDAETQESSWNELQAINPKILVHIQGHTAYVL